MNEFSKETLELAKSFDLIGEDYEKSFGKNPHQEAAMAWLTDRLQPKEMVLDIGSGDGLGTAKPLTDADISVLGIDVSQEMLRLAKRNVPQADFKQMDMRNLKLEREVYDAITAFFSLICLPKSEFPDVIANIVKQLRVGGFFVFSLIEGHFDNREVIFLNQKVRLSTYLIDEIRAEMAKLPLVELKVKRDTFKPSSGGFRESQLFFFYQKVKEE